jgi:hypothetical protein
MKQQSIEQQLAAMSQPTADLARMAQVHGRPNSDPEELIEQFDLFLYPVTIHERHMYRDEFTWAGGTDELEFERYVVGKRRIAYFTRQLEASRGILGGEHE